jgi:uncharacterized membrane protein HdeD (DUF308 family)
MPLRYRLLITLLGAFLLVSGVLGIVVGAHLTGWPQFRGVVGGLIAGGLGVRVAMYALVNRPPEWLKELLED